MITEESANQLLSSEIFLNEYLKYKEKVNVSKLSEFLDNIETNKKYYRIGIVKNKKYKKKDNDNTHQIKKSINLLNKLTEMNYHDIKNEILKGLSNDCIVSYIIEEIIDKSIIHKQYSVLYVKLLTEINEPTKKYQIKKHCDNYYNKIFNSSSDINNSDYIKLCDKNKKTDNMAGFSLLITHLELNNLIENYINTILDPLINTLLELEEEIQIFQLLVCLETICNLYYKKDIPENYIHLLNTLKSKTKSSKIKFKIMDILNE
jgi:hypothetical protein